MPSSLIETGTLFDPASTLLWKESGYPAVNVVDQENEILVTAELPGLEKDDFNLEIEQDRLLLRGEKKTEKEDKKGSYVIRESQYGSFSRSIPLPAAVDREAVHATYKQGVLRVTLPKTAEAKKSRIPVKVS